MNLIHPKYLASKTMNVISQQCKYKAGFTWPVHQDSKKSTDETAHWRPLHHHVPHSGMAQTSPILVGT